MAKLSADLHQQKKSSYLLLLLNYVRYMRKNKHQGCNLLTEPTWASGFRWWSFLSRLSAFVVVVSTFLFVIVSHRRVHIVEELVLTARGFLE